MSKDIWHTPPQTPDVFKSHPIIVVYEAGDQIEQMDSKEYSDLVGERYVNRWCYVDELIKENDSTRKALDDAKKWLMKIGYLDMTEHGLGSEKMMTDWCKTVALHGLKEIETALEQKDVK